jgi:hypothetical protein
MYIIDYDSWIYIYSGLHVWGIFIARNMVHVNLCTVHFLNHDH